MAPGPNLNPHGMVETRPSLITAALMALLPSGGPVLLEGGPGVGKSALFAQAAADTSRRYYSPRVSQYDPTEIAGIAWPDAEGQALRWLTTNGEFPWCPCQETCSCPPSILCIDELGQAPVAVQNVCLQLLHHNERRLRTFKLPPADRCFIGAATNRTTDRAGSGQLTTAVRSRFLTSFYVVPHIDDLGAIAARDGWHPSVRSWLRTAPGFLYDFDPARPGPFSCPRTIEQMSRLAALDVPPAARMATFAGAAGTAAAASYLAHADVYDKVPDAAAILADPAACFIPTEAPLLFAVTAILSAAMRGEKRAEPIAAMLTYADRMPGEYAALTVLDSMRAGCAVMAHKAGVAFAARHRSLILAAKDA